MGDRTRGRAFINKHSDACVICHLNAEPRGQRVCACGGETRPTALDGLRLFAHVVLAELAERFM